LFARPAHLTLGADEPPKIRTTVARALPREPAISDLEHARPLSEGHSQAFTQDSLDQDTGASCGDSR
jgi:hypothetical protein